MNPNPSEYAAIVGNSRLLCVVSPIGIPLRLFWPNIDYGQHIDTLRLAISSNDLDGVLWLDSRGWIHTQRYLPGTNVVETRSVHHKKRFALISTVFALTDRDSLVLSYRFEDKSGRRRDLDLNLYSVLRINESVCDNTALINEPAGTVAFYLRDVAVAISGQARFDAYQCGVRGEPSSALSAVETRTFLGTRIQHKSPDTAVRWNVGPFDSQHECATTLFITLASRLDDAIAANSELSALEPAQLEEETTNSWNEWARRDNSVLESRNHTVRIGTASSTDNAPENSKEEGRRARWRGSASAKSTSQSGEFITALNKLCGPRAGAVYERSLFALKLLSDGTGALIAAPEFDRFREVCGGYGYVWP
ncbi:MAG TPA: hypothetical protein VI756_16910, partial [Blastocatellia bacterium]